MAITTKREDQHHLTLVIASYLERLQGGKYGVPSMQDLQAAGVLHRFLEMLAEEEGEPK